MKPIKMKIISFFAAATLFIPMASVNAAPLDTNTVKFGNGLLNQQKNIEAKKEKTDAKAIIKTKKDTIKQNHETNASLAKEISTKKASIKAMIKDITSNKKQLSSDDLTKAQAQIKVIQDDITALENTKGTIKQDFDKFKQDMKAKSYTTAEADLDSIISIQNTRTKELNKLSGDLDTLINILKNASAASSTSSDTAAPAL
ncbi:MAG: hypothetical protein K0R54_496 [Clostridiaceae bacterium]|jgi:chromosome segregation ATPase|nr:hypothetical protein [Clostridiaceae bacterium]